MFRNNQLKLKIFVLFKILIRIFFKCYTTRGIFEVMVMIINISGKKSNPTIVECKLGEVKDIKRKIEIYNFKDTFYQLHDYKNNQKFMLSIINIK